MDATVPRTISLLAALAIAGSSLTACAAGMSKQRADEPGDFEGVAAGKFAGNWSIEWCDKDHPEWDCGGFDISLVQEGERLCGDFGGQRINRTQIDEGNIVGTVVGNTAILAVKSLRSGRIALVRAELGGHQLRWKDIDSIDRGGDDINLIAGDAILSRVTGEKNEDVSGRRTCESILSGREK